MTITVVADLNRALSNCLEEDERVILWGEDLLSPYGGAFKVTAGISDKFPSRVIATPICEASIVGLAVGASIRGLRPVVEVMFGDFITLAADQLINHAAKFPGMYNGQITTSIVVRSPMGGYRGYGPTHSQSLEKHFLGVPGLRVVAINHFTSPGDMLYAATMNDPMPVLFIENKALYPHKLYNNECSEVRSSVIVNSSYPLARIENYDSGLGADVTAVSYGGLSRIWVETLRQLADEEIRVELFFPSDISAPLDNCIISSCARSKKLLVAEEGVLGFGYGSQVIADIAQKLGKTTHINFSQVAAQPTVIPSDKVLEEEMLPSVSKISNAIIELL